MQQTPQMIPMVPSFPPTNITTEQIQKYLDENKKLIMAILESQNLGKLAECAQYQAVLQKNLMYLAAIADAQPQQPPAPSVAPQMAPHPGMRPPAYFMQQQQPPNVIFPSRGPLQFNSPHLQQLQDPQAAAHGHFGIGPLAVNNGPQPATTNHPETSLGSGGNAVGRNDDRGGNKQEGFDAGHSGGDGK
ncbi:PREDICTED: GRF1-interacting factor 3-like isoform X2 [Tarenaya hassleriana]|uniref:GRF1-interacting factor 3-like isoform X2 n=1 Tax=Tarenaya hassleriana TaxID=28532 RepID=UPI00053C8A58|nr:PREDICTED: GRF1-interacting factor 3-like isoform X2 [Tarenaya hassleriana]